MDESSSGDHADPGSRPVPSDLPKLPLDSDVPAHVLGRRGAFSACSTVAHRDDPDPGRASKHKRRGGISIERGEKSELRIRVVSGSVRQEVSASEFRGILTRMERALIASLKTEEGQQRCTGKFLTLRHQPRKVVRSRRLKSLQNQSVVEEAYHKQALKVLSRVGEWNFNTFVLDTMTGGRSLPTLLFHLFQHYGLMDEFRLDVVKVWKCFGIIEEGYHSNNPYHNAIHATDVTQAMHCFLQEPKILEHITPLELMTSLLAAVAHDLDHPGVNQPFLIATSNHLAALYRNSSVLENHHWRSALCCLSQSGMLNHLDRKQWDDITFQIRSLILATDITRQHEFLARLKHYLESETLDLSDQHYRHFVLQIALKCADICNPCRPWDISTRWSHQVCEEFFRQGDFERQLNLPISALCDRNNTTIAKIQSGFFRFVVAPLFEEWDLFLQTSLSSTLVKNLRCNQKKWDQIVAEENAKPLAVPPTIVQEACEETVPSQLAPDDALNAAALCSIRRHSVPLSLPRAPPPRLALHPEVVQLHRQPSTWATSLSTIASHLAEDLFPVTPAPRRLLTKQNTFPPPPSWHGRLQQRQAAILRQSTTGSLDDGDEQEAATASDDCGATNGCGTPCSSECDSLAESDSITVTDDGNIGKSVFGSRKSKPLLRLKSDSDLLQHSGKVLVGTRNTLATNNEEEKENADPCVRTPASWRNQYRKGKPQGVGMMLPRFMGRRGSAPVGLLKEETIVCLRSGPDIREQTRRRDSAPVDLLQDQFILLQQAAGKGVPGTRRGSLPSEIPLDVNAPLLADILLPANSETLRPCGAELLSTAFRRRSMPTDLVRPPVDILRKAATMFSMDPRGAAIDELFPAPGRSLSSNGMESPCGAAARGGEWTRGIQRLLCQTHSFDASFSDAFLTQEEQPTEAMPSDFGSLSSSGSSGNCNTWIVENRRTVFPFHRRSSVPTEVCLFGASSDEDQPPNLVVEMT